MGHFEFVIDWSSSCGHTHILEAFIQTGANIDKVDEFGDAARDYAEQAKQDTTYVLLSQPGGLWHRFR